MPGTLFVVATPIGNLEDVSARALRVLREAAVIAAEDTRRTSHLLARFAIATPTTSLHEHNERGKAKSIVDRLVRGEDVALVSDAGTPTVSDPGHALVQAAIDAGIRVEPIPGPNAAIAALAASGFPADRFTFLGFPPTRSKDRKTWFDDLRRIGGVVVFYEAPHRIRQTLDELARIAGNCPIVVGRELTKAHEQFLRGPVRTINDLLGEPRGEFTVVANIGQSTENIAAKVPSATELALEFGHLTNNGGMTRRQVVSALARKHHIPASQVYDAIESSKKLG